jgi:hypothetical protein
LELLAGFTDEFSMLFGAAGQSFSMIILAVMVRSTYQLYAPTCLIPVQDKLGGKGPGIVAALFLFLFNTFFAIGWLGMTWLYPAEIVPLRIRAPANALATSANWVTMAIFATLGRTLIKSRHSTSWS